MSTEVIARFDCFGGSCAVLVGGSGPAGRAPEVVWRAKRRMLDWHDQFSRFQETSELTRLNADPRPTVPVSAAMAQFVARALHAAQLTGGLVDPTLVSAIEQAGYRETLTGPAVALEPCAEATGSPAGPSPARAWRSVEVDRVTQTVTRPPGVRLDSGGIVKGMFADILAGELAGHESFAVLAAGDLRVGGVGSRPRPVQVASPFDESILHVFELVHGAAATSGISRRSWRASDGSRAHHLLDPATGRPAVTGVVQATALAPTATEAEALSKAALLSGPAGAASWLQHGGLVVYADGGIDVIEPSLNESDPQELAAVIGE